MNINLLETCNISSPGAIPLEGDVVQVKLNPKYPIGRLAFTFKESTLINESSDLVFSFKSSTPENINADILRGDVGFPEIHVENIDGETFRFKRGNLKDFLNIRSIEEPQEVRLPYSSFLYHIDLATNNKSTNKFFSTAVSKVNFDFLSNSHSEIILDITNPRFERRNKNSIDAIELINLESMNKSKSMPLFVTESGAISFAVSKNTICRSLHPGDLELNWKVTSPKIHTEGQLVLNNSKSYIELPVDCFGSSCLDITVSEKQEFVAKTKATLVRTLPRSSQSTNVLGISDEYCFDEINNLGGKFRRIVVSLTSIIKENSTFRFSYNNNPFEMLNGRPGEKYIVALKGMPKWLSKFPDGGDSHRHGPSNLEDYRELASWLVKNFSEKGIYAVESWNEANVIHEWNDSFTTLRDMQETLWDLVQEAGKPFLVLSPSSTSWDFPFFTKLLELGIYDFSDGLAMHAYTYEPDRHQLLFKELEKITNLAANGRNNFSCFITEVGFRIPSFSTYDQAAYLVLFTLQVFFRKRFSSIIWFRYRNARPESVVSYNQNASCGYAMVGYHDIYARPMLSAYRFIDNFLANSKAVGVEEFLNETIFHGTNKGERFIISYSEKKAHLYIINKNIYNYSAYDIYGNKITKCSFCDHKIMFCIISNK